jgi:hypothetical protein
MNEKKKYTRSFSNHKANNFQKNIEYYFVEYKKENFSGFFISERKHKTFEEAQKEREKLILLGATEALIKKYSPKIR